MIGAIERLYRIVMCSVGRGRITAGKTTGPVQTYQVKINDMDIRDEVPRIAEFGFTSRPPNGSDVALVCIEGSPRKSAIVGTNHQPSLPQGLLEGEAQLFNLWGMYVYMTQAGIVIEAKNQPVTINNATQVTINAATGVQMNTPILRVSGDIIDNSGTNPHTMAQMRTIYNGHNHVVASIQTGLSSVTSNAPAQTE
ncbi:phage baseplate assembly protein [Janthinobacterium sp.]|uniref:phage baseplate assembly protein domain-containing protein n=1 Tax=Janthinobacterium sp. TaxID=1871054 RepID=UPI00293D6A58|nr:phage baseplate assembly protein [Janthinobacterium sp.]